MSFRKLRGVNIPEERQGLIRYTCLTINEQPKWKQEKIRRLCEEHGGLYSAALFEAMTSKQSMTAIAMKHCVSESVLYRARKAFYEGWYKR